MSFWEAGVAYGLRQVRSLILPSVLEALQMLRLPSPPFLRPSPHAPMTPLEARGCWKLWKRSLCALGPRSSLCLCTLGQKSGGRGLLSPTLCGPLLLTSSASIMEASTSLFPDLIVACSAA